MLQKPEHRFQVVTVLLPCASVSSTPSGDLQLGDKATLRCQVSGLMAQSTVAWQRPDGSQYPGSQDADLTSVTLSDAGQWNCMFSYEGVTYSQGLDIKVTGRTLASPKLFSDFNSNQKHNNCVSVVRACCYNTCTSPGPGPEPKGHQ